MSSSSSWLQSDASLELWVGMGSSHAAVSISGSGSLKVTCCYEWVGLGDCMYCFTGSPSWNATEGPCLWWPAE